jgi:hypothetical protein
MRLLASILAVAVLSINAGATFTAIFIPNGQVTSVRVVFDAAGNPRHAILCAVDSAAGVVCASVAQDAAGRPLAIDGTGNLINQASVIAAFKTVLTAEAAHIIAEANKQTADGTRRGKISVPVTAAQLN